MKPGYGECEFKPQRSPELLQRLGHYCGTAGRYYSVQGQLLRIEMWLCDAHAKTVTENYGWTLTAMLPPDPPPQRSAA